MGGGVLADLAGAVQVPHGADQLLGVGGGQGAALLQDGLQLPVRQVPHMQLQEPAAEGAGQHLAPSILPCTAAAPVIAMCPVLQPKPRQRTVSSVVAKPLSTNHME